MSTRRGVVFLLNRRFLPLSEDGPYRVGASHCALRAAKALRHAGFSVEFLAYRHQPDLSAPRCEDEERFPYPTIVFDFNFLMKREILASSLENALTRISSSLGGDGVPVLYHQTGVLLPFVPTSCTSVVTHHGPFVDGVVQILGEDLAQEAFRGGKDKIVHLGAAQRAGLAALLRSPSACAAEISPVQAQYLRDFGVPAERILRLTPPSFPWSSLDREEPLPAPLERFLEKASPGLLLVAAMARLDAFKGVDLLVDAAVKLRCTGHDVATLIVGDTRSADGRRAALLRRIPSSQQVHFLFWESLPRSQMLSLFRRARPMGVFVLTSRYETFGITPFEAMCSGLTTVVPDLLRWIGVAEYVPAHLRFARDVDSLAGMLGRFIVDRSLLAEGRRVAEALARSVGPEQFEQDVVQLMEMFADFKARDGCVQTRPPTPAPTPPNCRGCGPGGAHRHGGEAL